MVEQQAGEGQTLARYVEKRWGGPTRSLPLVTVAISGGGTRVAQANPRRMLIALFNNSTGNAYWGTNAADASAALVLLPPLGGSLILSADEDGELVGYEHWCSPVSGGTSITVLEVIRK